MTNSQTLLDQAKSVFEDRKVLTVTVTGSALYGASTDTSDEDYRAVFLPTKREILTGKTSFGLDGNVENKKLGLGDVDIGGVTLMRFLGLIGRMDMTYTEMLFASQNSEYQQAKIAPIFQKVFDQRDKLIAGNSNSAIGHARNRIGGLFPTEDKSITSVEKLYTVVNKLIADGCERFIDAPEVLNDIALLPGVKIVTAPNSAQAKSRNWDKITPEERLSGKADGQHIMVVIAGKKLSVTVPLSQIVNVLKRPLERAEQNKRVRLHGENVLRKDAYQGVRMIYQAIEIHRTRELVFPSSNVATLRKIRSGDMPDGDITQLVSDLMVELSEVEQEYPFPKEPCAQTMEDIVCEAHENVVLNK